MPTGETYVFGIPDAIVLAWVAVVGAFIGSFLNVVVYRVPARRSIVFPGSRCGFCETHVRWYDNIPVLSWIALRGRCRHCGVRISVRYALVELLTSALFVAVVMRFGLTWLALAYAAFVAALVAVTFIDADHRIIPDSISKGGVVAGLVVAAAVTLLIPRGPGLSLLPVPLPLAIAGAVLGWVSLRIFAALGAWYAGQEAMGLGDVKLLAMIGAFLGPWSLPFVFFAAAFTGGAYGVATNIVRRRRLRGSTMPFGPFLALAAVLYLLAGHELMLAWILVTGGSRP